jgi:hypothetical protein
VDVFNVFNNHRVERVNQVAEMENGAANPYYLEPLWYQRPRSVRLGFGLSF